MKKTISIVIPTYNEEGNVVLLHEKIREELKNNASNYNYEMIFIDNYSKDKTREKLCAICAKDRNVRAIFNAKNFGQFNSPFYGLLQTSGDCTILICADFQDPIEMIHEFIIEWEKGYKIVIGIKTKSKENSLMYFLRSCYYKIIKNISEVEQIEHFTGFGLYDKDFIDVLRNLDDSKPYLRGIVAELGYERKEIEYTQAKRLNGKTSNNWYKLYDAAMLGFTSYTKAFLRIATMLGFVLSIVSMLIALTYLILKLVFWDSFPMGTAPIVVGIFFMSSIQIFFIGFLGEYILNINARVMKRPLVIEEKRINF